MAQGQLNTFLIANSLRAPVPTSVYGPGDRDVEFAPAEGVFRVVPLELKNVIISATPTKNTKPSTMAHNFVAERTLLRSLPMLVS